MNPRHPVAALLPYTTLFRSPERPGRAWAIRSGRSACRSRARRRHRSEEHTSELQSRENLVCRLMLEKKNFLTASKQFRHVATSKSRSHTDRNSTKHKSPHLSGWIQIIFLITCFF